MEQRSVTVAASKTLFCWLHLKVFWRSKDDSASTSFRRHVPTRFLINQCQLITFLILKSDNIENSRIDLKGIILQVPSNQIKVTFISILPSNLVHL